MTADTARITENPTVNLPKVNETSTEIFDSKPILEPCNIKPVAPGETKMDRSKSYVVPKPREPIKDPVGNESSETNWISFCKASPGPTEAELKITGEACNIKSKEVAANEDQPNPPSK